MNLLLNAVEASPKGGTVRVEGAVEEAAEAGAGSVVLRIIDAGPGFPPEVLSGQAEEFFSTKSSGAGLGLSICRTIVEQAGGRLSLSNSPAGGAIAEVRLPLAPVAG